MAEVRSYRFRFRMWPNNSPRYAVAEERGVYLIRRVQEADIFDKWESRPAEK
jgi:hypothetical protein